MAVVIRLSRVGATHQSKYRITVADSRRAVKNGRYLEVIGHYNPKASGQEKPLHIDLEKASGWIRKGAQPTDRVAHLIKLASAAPKV
jgi:small subunit ribosomal protein S16